jgi:hypothetical protein
MQEQKAQSTARHSIRGRLFASALALAAALTISFGSSSAQAAPIKSGKPVCLTIKGVVVCVPLPSASE